MVEAGMLPASELNKMSWMYDWSDPKAAENNAEEYLLGKKVNDLDEVKPKIVDADNDYNEANEDFIKLKDDPLFEIKKEELRRKREIERNPIKMKEIFLELERREKLRKEKKKKKKGKGKKEKSKKKKKRKRDTDSQDDEEDDDRSLEREKKKRKKDKKKSRKSSSKRERSRSRDRRKSSRKSKRSRRDSSSSSEEANRSSTSTKASSKSEDKVFNEYVRKRLGPLVEFDTDNYRLKFTAKYRFKDNDRKRMTKDE